MDDCALDDPLEAGGGFDSAATSVTRLASSLST